MDAKEIKQNVYKHGWSSKFKAETFDRGLSEDIIRKISEVKDEPNWLLDWRLAAYHSWRKMSKPEWSELDIPDIDFNEISYFSRPKNRPKDLSEVDPSIIKTLKS